MATLTRGSLLLLVMLVITLPSSSQSARGTITGIIRDPTGAVVPGADIIITE